jgi:hypothetical protein
MYAKQVVTFLSHIIDLRGYQAFGSVFFSLSHAAVWGRVGDVFRARGRLLYQVIGLQCPCLINNKTRGLALGSLC